MFEVWLSEGCKRRLVARFRLEKDAQAHMDSYIGPGELELRGPEAKATKPHRRRHSGFVLAVEHEDEFIADKNA